MADQITVGELVYKLSGDMDNLKTELAKAETEIGKLRASSESTGSTIGKAFSTAATVVKGFIAAYAVKAVIDFGRAAVASASEQLEQQTKLAQVLRVSKNATDEQIASVVAQAQALENVGVISKDVTIAAQAQLATYDLSTESIKQLTPSLLDYLAAEKGANATKEDAIGLTNGLAQALQGNYGSLAKSGFILDEATKKTIENGNETERVTAIVSVLDSTYKDYNKTLGDTFLGTQVRAANIVDDFKNDLGFALMPAVQSVTSGFIDWANNIQGSNSALTAGTERINVWGRYIYQGAQFLIAMVKALVLTVKAVVGFGDTIIKVGNLVYSFAKDAVNNVLNIKDTFFNLGKGLIKLFSGDFEGALEAFQSQVKSTFSNSIAAWGDYSASQDYWAGQIADSVKSVGESIDEGINAKNFKPITAEALTAYNALNKTTDAFAGTGKGAKKAADEAEKAAQKIQDFQGKILDLIDAAKKAGAELQGDLAKSFKDFADGIQGNLSESAQNLAKIVVDAETKIKDINTQIADAQKDSNADSLKAREDLNDKIAKAQLTLSDKLRKIDADDKDAAAKKAEAQLLYDRQIADAQADYKKKTEGLDTNGADRLADLRAQLAEEQKILDSAAGYQERQAARIEEIRKKLNDAGIDTAASGLDQFLQSGDLQTQIEEERRRASQNEFQNFEEDQTKKLQILTDNFITETKLTEQKITKQKSLEADLTAYLQSEDSTRLDSTDAWAKSTIAKYGEVAAALQNVISLKSQLGDVGAAPIPSTPASAANQTNGSSSASTVNNNQKTVNTTINATNASPIDYAVIAKQIGFQTAK